ncbi:MAG: 1-deoxy-D-xylulose-5-phosphate synthase [Selenomonadaceae bacterium]|nr:1-deoxy-D-xylulose-5-phosphate synthase [Selenomonadaceae bacterium]
MSNLLSNIKDPAALKNMSVKELNALAEEIREYIIETVSKTGGHLAPSLGAVELIIALHSVFSAPTDKIIFDVGHQAYAHKILTGRYEGFKKLRQKGGVSGFPKRSESPYDAFGVGHASTSVSAALGMAIARDIKGEKYHVVAVVGDGAFTGGEVFEALNQAGALHKNLIVVLNDNERSIEKNVGAISEYLSEIRLMPEYHKAKFEAEKFLKSIPSLGERMMQVAYDIKNGIKSFFIPGDIFDDLGFQYIGPLHGHDIAGLQTVFAKVKKIEGPILIHVITKKGKGYEPAEKNPGMFHGIGKFDVTTGEPLKTPDKRPSYTEVFGKTLIELAKKDESIVAITAAMPAGTGLKAFQKEFPERFFDVGIAEEHAMTLAAGLASEGMHPVVAVYSTFMQRAYDQILHDVCLQNLPVTLALDRAGLVGEDGPTHHGVFDFSYLRHIPNIAIVAPKDENELRQMMCFALKSNFPVAVRYPRGKAVGVPVDGDFSEIPIGKAEILSDVGDIALLAVGTMVEEAKKARSILSKRGIFASVANMRFVKPFDKELLLNWSKNKRLFVTLEENALAGGFGSAVSEWMHDENINIPLLRFGIEDKFIIHASRSELFEMLGLTPEKIADRIEGFCKEASI